MAFLDATIVNVAFPDILATFPHVSLAGLSWVLNAYNIVFAALLVPAGQLADLLGRRRVFTAGLLAFLACSLLCALAPSVAALVVFRVGQAAGGAMLVPSALALLLAEFKLGERIRAIAMLGAAAAVAAASGPSLGGLLVHLSSWRLVFLVNVPLGALLLGVCHRLPREQRDPAAGRVPDWVAVATLTAGVALLALALTQSAVWGAGDARVIASLGGSALLLVAFAQRCRRHAHRHVELVLLRIATVRTANLAILAFAAAFYAKILIDVLFLTSVWHYSVLRTGAAITPGPLITALLALPAARLASRWGLGRIAAAGALVYAGGCAWYALRAGPHPSYIADWLPGTLFTGAGIALAFPTLTSAAVAGTLPADYGAASAVNATARQLGGVLGIAVTFAFLGSPTLATAHPAFVASWTYCAITATAAAAAAMTLRRRSLSTQPPTQDEPARFTNPAPTLTPPTRTHR
jgi:EmrB/QacA subfamily drug resistance transporter